jgi:hypothetical protein
LFPTESFFTSGEISTGGRSINLAISARGIAALESVDSALAARCLRNMIPMKGRFVHRIDGSDSKQNYDSTGQVPLASFFTPSFSPFSPVAFWDIQKIHPELDFSSASILSIEDY